MPNQRSDYARDVFDEAISRVTGCFHQICDDNAQMRENYEGMARWISRYTAFSAMLIDALLEVDREGLSTTQQEALAEYRAMHGGAVEHAKELRDQAKAQKERELETAKRARDDD